MTNRRRWTALAVGAVAMVFLLGASAANAAPVVLKDNNVAIGILNLEVGGTLYNIDFDWQDWPEIYGGPPPVFDFTEELAMEANEKINLALNAADVKQVGPPQEGQATEGFPLYAIGIAFDDPNVNWIGAAFVDNIDLWIDDFLSDPVNGAQSSEQRWMWAKATVVPVPGTVLLLGSGLAGLGMFARRRKRGA